MESQKIPSNRRIVRLLLVFVFCVFAGACAKDAFAAGCARISLPNQHLFENDGDFITTAFELNQTAKVNHVIMMWLIDPNSDPGGETFQVAITTDSAGNNALTSTQITDNFAVCYTDARNLYLFDVGDVTLTGNTTYYLRTKALSGTPIKFYAGCLIFYDDCPIPQSQILHVRNRVYVDVSRDHYFSDNGNFITTPFKVDQDSTARFAVMNYLIDLSEDSGKETFEVAITTDSAGTDVLTKAQISNDFGRWPPLLADSTILRFAF